jgi:hypothetical protein
LNIEFNRFTNHTTTNKENFSIIVFGRYAEVLEVELNELQSIVNSKMYNRFVEEGSGFLRPLASNIVVSYKLPTSTNWTVTLIDEPVLLPVNSQVKVIASNDIPVLTDGCVFTIPTNAELFKTTLSEPKTLQSMMRGDFDLFLNYKVSVIDYDKTLYKYGYIGEGKSPITNYIKDNRDNVETSRRKVVEFNITINSPDSTNFGTSRVLNKDYRYISSVDSQKWIIDSIISAMDNISNIKANYLKINDLIPSLPIANTTVQGIVRIATSNEVANTTGDGVVAAKDLIRYFDTTKILNVIYPIGSLYFTSDASFDPNQTFAPQSWERQSSGQVLTSGTMSGLYSTGSKDPGTTVLSRENLPAVTISSSGTTNVVGAHNHQVDNHSHYNQPHQHVSPWGDEGGGSPWGTYGSKNMWGSGKADTNNWWYYTSPTGMWSDGSAPYTNTTGSHSHGVGVTSESLGQSRPLTLNFKHYATIVWRRIS